MILFSIKFLARIIFFLFVVFVIIFWGRNFFIKAALENAVSRKTGFCVQIQEVSVPWNEATIEARNITFLNPPGFEEKIFLRAPHLFIRYDLLSLLKGKLVLNKVHLQVSDIIVVRGPDQIMNTDVFKSDKPGRGESSGTRPEKAELPRRAWPGLRFLIKVLEIKLGSVTYKDYSQGDSPAVFKLSVNMEKKLEDVTDFKSFWEGLGLPMLKGASPGGLPQLSPMQLFGSTQGALKSISLDPVMAY